MTRVVGSGLRTGWLVMVLLAGAASAEPTAKSMFVSSVRATGTNRDLGAMDTLVGTEAARYAVRVVTAADVASLLGLERQKALTGCAASSCTAELGDALGVDYLLVPDLGRVGSTWVMTYTLLDVKANRALARVSTTAETVDDHVVSVRARLAELLAPHFALAANESGPSRVPGLVVGGLGVAAVAAGAVFGVSALGSKATAVSLQTGTDFKAFDAAKQSATLQAQLADGCFVVGAVGIAVGAWLAFLRGGDGPATASLVPVREGGVLVVGGTF